ncbi:MAG: hypothetical protein RR064_06855 [Oscillospiraceae bacterium]
MSDIASKINEILNSEEGMNQIKALANSLGLGSNTNNQNSLGQFDLNGNSGGNQDFSNPLQNPSQPPQNQNQYQNQQPNQSQSTLDMLASLLGNNQPPPPQNNSAGLNFDPSMLFKLQGVLSKLNTNDSNTQLLMALKDHLSEERQKKVTDAIRIMQLIKILPVIKEMGLFGGDAK